MRLQPFGNQDRPRNRDRSTVYGERWDRTTAIDSRRPVRYLGRGPVRRQPRLQPIRGAREALAFSGRKGLTRRPGGMDHRRVQAVESGSGEFVRAAGPPGRDSIPRLRSESTDRAGSAA